jgi:hypothetical protein
MKVIKKSRIPNMIPIIIIKNAIIILNIFILLHYTKNPSSWLGLKKLRGQDSKEFTRRHCLLALLVAIQEEGSRHTTQGKQKISFSGEFCLLRGLDEVRTCLAL